jgi:L-lactate dehydrogenase complex protein LldG
MSAARDEVLERIRSALADRPSAVAVPRTYERALSAETDLIELFAERVAHYRATVRRARARDVPTTIAAVLVGEHAGRVVVPDGFPAAWLPIDSGVVVVRDAPPLTHADLDALDGALTGCAVAIAETGTIVLDSGPDQGRRALSLLPDLHVCVVGADRIVGSVPEALARLDARRPQTWISGPSATSDIELQRVEGVHGPRRLVVVIVEG